MPDWFAGWANPVAVLVGGGAGALARYAVGRWAAGFAPLQSFPWPTFGINVLGSFALGLVVAWAARRPDERHVWSVLLGTGFCGGFTTFSTFSVETLELLGKGRTTAAAAYAGGSVLAGLLAAFLAVRLLKPG